MFDGRKKKRKPINYKNWGVGGVDPNSMINVVREVYFVMHTLLEVEKQFAS